MNTDMIDAIHTLCLAAFPADEPGAAVIAVKDGQVVHRKGYGLANLELGVPVEPDMVFRIGSITKQFTAVAILMLMEASQLALDDPLTRFLPDYPTQGQVITIEHLLTHTSGIKSHTDMPEFFKHIRMDMSVDEMIAVFKDQPMQFAPGEHWAYNNSGFFLLGAIIEKVSGQAYAQFLQERIFNPLGMSHTYYDTAQRIIPRRAAGYERKPEENPTAGPLGYVNAEYLSMTLPYAAGALASTVDDLSVWDAALYTDRLVRPESLQRAWTPYRLADGSSTGYGYGWSLSAYAGRATIEHGGGINGFICQALRIPEEHAFVAVLTNTTYRSGAVEPLALKIAGQVIGQPYLEPQAVQLDGELLKNYPGTYRRGEGEQREEWTFALEQDRLSLQIKKWPRIDLGATGVDDFFSLTNSFTRLHFLRDGAGIVTGVELHQRSGQVDTYLKD